MHAVAIDFETRSWRDISDGAPAYAEDPRTEVMCAAFADTEGRTAVWRPGEDLPGWVTAAMADPAVMFVAHNASFELSIISSILAPLHAWPEVPLNRWIDTMHLCLLYGLPPGLEAACSTLKLDVQKDTEGADLMLRLCRPRKVGGEMVLVDPTPAEQERLEQYCLTDVLATLQLLKRLPVPGGAPGVAQVLGGGEAAVMLVDREINQRGVCVDLELAQKMAALARLRAEQLQSDVSAAAGDAVSLTSTPALKAWLQSRNIELPKAKRKRENGEVVETVTLALSTVQQLLATSAVQADAEVVSVLQSRVAASKLTSLAKLDTIQRMTNADGRLRCLLRYYGAHTGRWTSSGVQLHNLPKSRLKDKTDLLREMVLAYDGRTKASGETTLRALEAVGGDALAVFSQLLRSLIVAAPGCDFIGADYSAIEARVLAWLADETSVLDVFRRREDIYVADAKAIGSTDRQLGKVCRLALGYGMGAVKFIDTAAGYGIKLEPKLARTIVQGWRKANGQTTAFWSGLQDAFCAALDQPGIVHGVGRISVVGSRGVVAVKLPSGRVIRYHQPSLRKVTRAIDTINDQGERCTEEVEMVEIGFFRAQGGAMRHDSTYGGKLAENVCQAVARDLLAEALVRLRSSMYTPVLHVHDSILSEVPRGTGAVEDFADLITALPPWADGLPMAAEGYRAKYFKG